MPDQNYYAKNHEWVRFDGDGLAMVGLTPEGLTGFGVIDAVDLPAPGRNVVRGEVCAVLHSGAVRRDILAPLSGTIAEHNAALGEKPADLTAQDWLFRMRLVDVAAVAELMSGEDYRQFVDSKK
jgi:glycine cleavage system H protein